VAGASAQATPARRHRPASLGSSSSKRRFSRDPCSSRRMPRLSRCGKIQLPIAQGFTAAAELMRSSVPIRGAPLQNRGRRGTVGAGGGAGSACGSQNCFSSGNISRCHSWPQRHLHKDTSTPSLLFASSRSGLRTRCSFMRGGSSVGVASITLHSSQITAWTSASGRRDLTLRS